MPTPLRSAIQYLKEAIAEPMDSLHELKRLVNSMVDDPALDSLTARELRAFHGFRMTLDQCEKMEPDTMPKYVYAHWEGGEVKQAILKLPIGKKAFAVYNKIVGKKE